MGKTISKCTFTNCKKNGKNNTNGSRCSYRFKNWREGGMDIVCASNDDKQASLLWNGNKQYEKKE